MEVRKVGEDGRVIRDYRAVPAADVLCDVVATPGERLFIRSAIEKEKKEYDADEDLDSGPDGSRSRSSSSAEAGGAGGSPGSDCGKSDPDAWSESDDASSSSSNNDACPMKATDILDLFDMGKVPLNVGERDESSESGWKRHGWLESADEWCSDHHSAASEWTKHSLMELATVVAVGKPMGGLVTYTVVVSETSAVDCNYTLPFLSEGQLANKIRVSSATHDVIRLDSRFTTKDACEEVIKPIRGRTSAALWTFAVAMMERRL